MLENLLIAITFTSSMAVLVYTILKWYVHPSGPSSLPVVGTARSGRSRKTSDVRNFMDDFRDFVGEIGVPASGGVPALAYVTPLSTYESLAQYLSSGSGSQLVSTAFLPEYKFYGTPEFQTAEIDFLKRGGQLTRVYFYRNEAELSDPDLNQSLARDKEAGIKVYVIPEQEVPVDLRRSCHFDVDENVAWKSFGGVEHGCGAYFALEEEKDVQEWKERIELLLQARSVRII